jgi:uncharacterized coiled-coil DUF342 family protein
MNIFSTLQNKYREIVNNNSTNIEFELKLLEIYDIEFELLKTIFNLQENKNTNEKNNNIIKKIESIKTVRHDTKKYNDELNKLSELLYV